MPHICLAGTLLGPCIPLRGAQDEVTKLSLPSTWTPKVCKMMAFMAIIRGLGLLFYMLVGFR